ncbi:MAG TPA: hypothetical protein VNH65_22360 [Candidatus Acidoferrum sp.]|nr:hypothetical protein [Candidatus Acidoferrum sp.]
MSFDLYFQPVVDGQPLEITRAELRSLFPVVEKESEPDYWKIRYDPVNTCHIGVTALPSEVNLLSSFYIERPCTEPRLWEALFRVLNGGPIVLYFPGGPPIVASDEVRAALPKNVIGSLGEPRCVHSAAEIRRIIRES